MRRAWLLLPLVAFAIPADDRLFLTTRGLPNPVAVFDSSGNVVLAGLAGVNGQPFFTPCLAGETCATEPRPLTEPQIYVAAYTRTADRRLYELTFPAAGATSVSALLLTPDGGLIVATGNPASVRRYDERQNLRWTATLPPEAVSLGLALRANGDVIYAGSRPQLNLSPLAMALGRITPEGRVEPSPVKLGATRIAIAPDGSVLLAGEANGGVDQAFPATPGAWQPTAPMSFCGSGFIGFPCQHQFLAHVSADLQTLKMATYLSGLRGARPAGPPMLLPDGSIAVAGSTVSDDYHATAGAWIAQFPSRVPTGFRGAIQSSAGFLSVVSGDGRQLLYSTFLGGAGAASVTAAELADESHLRLAGLTTTGFAGLRGRTEDCTPYDPRLGAGTGLGTATFEMEFDLAARRFRRSLVRPVAFGAGSRNQDQRLMWSLSPEASALMLVDVALREPAPAIHCAEEPASAEPQADQLAPSQLAALFGAGWPLTERTIYDPAAAELPRELGGVRLLAEGDPLALLYVSPDQINFVTPSRWQPGERKRLELEVNGERIAARNFTVIPRRPVLFLNIANPCSFTTSLAINPASGEPYDCRSPAPRDGVISLFVQGIGLNPERQQDGQINRELDITPPVAIESPQAELLSVTPALGQAAGLWQARVRLNGEASGVARFPLRIGVTWREVTVQVR